MGVGATTSEERPLARFIDRHTMTYERVYPHPIERVWEAVTTASHLDAWMLPTCVVEPRLGGRCAFGWGGPAPTEDGVGASGTVSVFEPPTAVQYTFWNGSFLRFDLQRVTDGETALHFTLHFLPDGRGETLDDPGGDLPGGPDTAWQPGFLAGYHHMLDTLDTFLRGEWTLADNERSLEHFRVNGWDEDDLVLMDAYRALVREHCPR